MGVSRHTQTLRNHNPKRLVSACRVFYPNSTVKSVLNYWKLLLKLWFWVSSNLVYLILPVELHKDGLPPLTVPKPTTRLLALPLTLSSMEIFILWWIWLILVLQIALYTNVLSSSANWREFNSWIWLLHSLMAILFITLALLVFLSTFWGNLPLLICWLDVVCWITYIVTWCLVWIGYKPTILYWLNWLLVGSLCWWCFYYSIQHLCWITYISICSVVFLVCPVTDDVREKTPAWFALLCNVQ